MISELEIWAAAQKVVKEHGGKASEEIGRRVAELAMKGDAEGVATWKAIADRVDQLTNYKGTGQARH